MYPEFLSFIVSYRNTQKFLLSKSLKIKISYSLILFHSSVYYHLLIYYCNSTSITY